MLVKINYGKVNTFLNLFLIIVKFKNLNYKYFVFFASIRSEGPYGPSGLFLIFSTFNIYF